MSIINIIICITGGAFIGAIITFVSMVLAFAAGEHYDDK